MFDTKSEKIQKLLNIAREILVFSRNSLLVNYRFLDMAIGHLEFAPFPLSTIGTNGAYICYNPDYILKAYKECQQQITRDYLHAVFHCILKHFEISHLVDPEIWDLATDIAVENAINEIGAECIAPPPSGQTAEAFKIKDKINMLTAEKVYRYLLDSNLSKDNLDALRKLFSRDDHSLWYLQNEQEKEDDKKQQSNQGAPAQGSGRVSEGEAEGEAREDGDPQTFADYVKQLAKNGEKSPLPYRDPSDMPSWKDISERALEDLETFSKQHGDMAGCLVQNLKEVTREKYDYTMFLKKFATLHEAMQINDDEFDYIFYTYGLKLYENMPLVEPLEYKDVKRVKDIVIAIDTSGSVAGGEVQSFLQKTFNILKNEESFFKKFNLHLIQCDAKLQEDKKITTQEEFDEYIKTMKLHGFGGTDFRPVFNYVEKLIGEHEFDNLKGLIYFTDGFGVFPEKKPPYDTAFVFVTDGIKEIPQIPPWAIKLVLTNEDLK